MWSAAVSILAGLLLAAALVILADIDGREILELLFSVQPAGFAALVVLLGLNVVLAAEKWMLVEDRLTWGESLPRPLSLALTALGTAAGQVLPIQLATVLTRSLGARIISGSGTVRSAVSSIFEQAFDLIVVAPLGILTLVCLGTGDATGWPFLAASTLLAVLAAIGPTMRRGSAVAGKFAGHGAAGARLKRLLNSLTNSGLVDPGLARRLFLLSAARFAILCAAAAATSEAVGLDVPALHLAAAMPLVVLASVFVTTPAGLGVNEFTFGVVLAALGTPFDAAVEWALVNRVLVTVASLIIGGIGGAILQWPRKRSA